MAQTVMQDIFSQNSKSTWQAQQCAMIQVKLKTPEYREISEEINSKFHSVVSLVENESGFICNNRLKFLGFVCLLHVL